VWPGLTTPMLDYMIESIHEILGEKSTSLTHTFKGK
jgi:hypothetical protein